MPAPNKPSGSVPDAIMYPAESLNARSREAYALRDRLDAAFAGPVFKLPPGSKLAYRSQGPQLFITQANDHTPLLFPKDHPLYPRERFDWYVAAADQRMQWEPELRRVASYGAAPGAVLFGFLVDEDEVDPPGTAEKTEALAATAERDARYAAMMVRLQELLAKTVAGESLSPGEVSEYEDISREVEKLARPGAGMILPPEAGLIRN